MDAARWERIAELLDSALRLQPQERTGFLREVCAGDDGLRAEAESMLAYEDRVQQFLAFPAAEMATGASGRQALPPGLQIGPYRILAPLGAGGMGEVYRAEDTRLDRDVALKFLAAISARSPEALERFRREARAASALNHPHICTLYDIGEHEGQPFLVMELLEGHCLKERLSAGALPVPELLDVGLQIAEALDAAHGKNIVHRDIKPGNVFLTAPINGRFGSAKILDFGLAKLRCEPSAAPEPSSWNPEEEGVDAEHTITRLGTTVGTAAYMSPEQARGEPVDARTDLFSFGVLLYEMATGVSPFHEATRQATVDAILHKQPVPPRELAPRLPRELEGVIRKALEKDRASRYQTASGIHADLERTQRRSAGLLRNRRVAALTTLAILAAITIAAWFGIRSRRERWARNIALPRIAEFVARENFDAAFRLGRDVERYIPRDPELIRLRHHYQIVQSVATEPPGADVYVKGYLNITASWIHLGKSPIQNAPMPRGHDRWRVTKPGFETAEGAYSSYTGLPLPVFKLDPLGSAPAEMVRVPGGTAQAGFRQPLELADYWLDRHEVSNREFKVFVDRGGYRRREYWKHPFVRDGVALPWIRAIDAFHDRTGLPGPATWNSGTYPEGKDDFPVTGVSWYEAAAYAEFAAKSLPTFHQWRRAAGNLWYSDILRLSNFSGSGPVPVRTHEALSPFGHYDMAGNVREWCWNQAGTTPWERRYILGGSWMEAPYMFTEDSAAPPFDRSDVNGFRCARNKAPVPDTLLEPIGALARDYSREKPVNDEIFRVYRAFYSYDRADLRAAIESVDDASRDWRRETVSFDAAYANERVIAHLFLPRSAAPPYQTVIYFPGSGSLVARSSEELELMVIDFLLRNGRAVLYPVYKGMYERRMDPSLQGRNFARDRIIYWSKDFSRSVDYLQTRPDTDHERLAFFGFSLGGIFGPVLTAIDGRMKAAVLLGGGLSEGASPPEADPLHFAPRAKEPVLIIAGRFDYARPIENCQVPLLRLLGAPAEDKRLAIVETGHVVYPSPPVVKEIIDWLDRYLGKPKSR